VDLPDIRRSAARSPTGWTSSTSASAPRAEIGLSHQRNLDFRDLIPYYALADVMAVTSLHDGMNLVAKEYVAARVHNDGVLVLSPYTGASRELEPPSR
jgi:hypothetical protein